MGRSLLPILILSACCIETSCFTPSGSTVSESSIRINRLDADMHVDIDINTVPLPSQVDNPVCDRTESKIRELPPVLQQIADERQEFQLNLGKAMDTLRKDMPEILKKAPDYSIYDESITVIDPSGVRLNGIDSYKSSIRFLQTFIKFWFQDRSGLQYRMVYDFCRSSIRVSWHAVLVPKVPLGRPLYVDGISMYRLEPGGKSGKIVEHKIERLMINNMPVMPPYGVFSLLQQDLTALGRQQGPGVPAGI